MSDDVRQKVRGMAQLTILSGRLSEIQEKNLKLYPFIFFNDISSVKMDYDIEVSAPEKTLASSSSRIRYHLTIDEKKNPAPEKGFQYLENSVRTLLWQDMKISVYFNDKVVFESSNEQRQ